MFILFLMLQSSVQKNTKNIKYSSQHPCEVGRQVLFSHFTDGETEAERYSDPPVVPAYLPVSAKHESVKGSSLASDSVATSLKITDTQKTDTSKPERP